MFTNLCLALLLLLADSLQFRNFTFNYRKKAEKKSRKRSNIVQLADGVTALAQLYALYSHRARSFNKWQRTWYLNFIIKLFNLKFACFILFCLVFFFAIVGKPMYFFFVPAGYNDTGGTLGMHSIKVNYRTKEPWPWRFWKGPISLFSGLARTVGLLKDVKLPFMCTLNPIGEKRSSISTRSSKLCNVRFHRWGTKVLSSVLQTGTSALNILIILSVFFAKRFCQTLGGTILFPSYKNISIDSGEYTGKHLPVLRAMLIFTILESPLKGRLANVDRWVDFDDSNNSLNVRTLIYGEIIPDLNGG